MKDCGLFNPHDWGKWVQFYRYYRTTILKGDLVGKEYDSIEKWQKKKCHKCGKQQEEKI